MTCLSLFNNEEGFFILPITDNSHGVKLVVTVVMTEQQQGRELFSGEGVFLQGITTQQW